MPTKEGRTGGKEKKGGSPVDRGRRRATTINGGQGQSMWGEGGSPWDGMEGSDLKKAN